MGFSCGDHFDEKESEFPLITEEENSITMEVYDDHVQGGVVDKSSTVFCPVEHPMEPPDEDRPVKCPMPESSVINDERMHEKRFAESLKKRADGERTTTTTMEAAEPLPRARGVRKRHHTTLTHEGGDLVMTPLMRMPPLPPLQLQSQNITIFQVLQQQLDKFDS